MSRGAVTTIISVALGLALLVSWRWDTRRESNPLDSLSQKSNPTTVAISATPPPLTPDRGEERKERQEERVKTINALIEGGNVPIDFWGKVVDQDARPIGGAEVAYSYSTEHGNMLGVAWSASKVHKGTTFSDISGLLSIQGLRGSGLTIESLRKEGFEYHARGAQVFNFYGSAPAGKFAPDPKKPVVFVMFRKSAAEPLVQYRKLLEAPGNGTPARWNLWRGSRDPNGDLQITFKREPSVLARVGQPVTWSAKVEVINGGIVEAPPDESSYRAPEEGYASMMDYPKAQQRQGLPERSFYIKTPDGKYGRLELRIYADDEGASARCYIGAFLNPSGSRNLEPGDLAQQIRVK